MSSVPSEHFPDEQLPRHCRRTGRSRCLEESGPIGRVGDTDVEGSITRGRVGHVVFDFRVSARVRRAVVSSGRYG